MQYLQYIIGGFSILLGLLFYSNSKRKDAEAALSNIKTKQSIAKKDGQVDAIDEQIEQEEKNKDNHDVQDLEHFFNRPPDSK